MRWILIFLVMVIFLSPVTACGPSSPGSPVGKEAQAPPASKAEGKLPGVSQSIEGLIDAAKKEGRVMVYVGPSTPEVRSEVTRAFRDKYGIAVDFVTGRLTELMARLQAEQRAGLPVADLIIMGDSTWFNDMHPMGVTTPLEPMFILPEVKDQSKWRGGKYPMIDQTGQAMAISLLANNFYTINKDMVKESELTTVTDLLKPSWKGNIVLNDPTVGGNGVSWLTFLFVKLLGEEKGKQFMRDLARQEPILSRDSRQMVEWVARGKYPLVIGASMTMSISFISQGAPIRMTKLKDGTSLTTGVGVVAVTSYAPHPAATRLFLNWLLSKEGSSIWAKENGYPSSRLDASTEGILPDIVPSTGDTMPEEAYFKKWDEIQKASAEIFAPLIK